MRTATFTCVIDSTKRDATMTCGICLGMHPAAHCKTCLPQPQTGFTTPACHEAAVHFTRPSALASDRLTQFHSLDTANVKHFGSGHEVLPSNSISRLQPDSTFQVTDLSLFSSYQQAPSVLPSSMELRSHSELSSVHTDVLLAAMEARIRATYEDFPLPRDNLLQPAPLEAFQGHAQLSRTAVLNPVHPLLHSPAFESSHMDAGGVQVYPKWSQPFHLEDPRNSSSERSSVAAAMQHQPWKQHTQMDPCGWDIRHAGLGGITVQARASSMVWSGEQGDHATLDAAMLRIPSMPVGRTASASAPSAGSSRCASPSLTTFSASSTPAAAQHDDELSLIDKKLARQLKHRRVETNRRQRMKKHFNDLKEPRLLQVPSLSNASQATPDRLGTIHQEDVLVAAIRLIKKYMSITAQLLPAGPCAY